MPFTKPSLDDLPPYLLCGHAVFFQLLGTELSGIASLYRVTIRKQWQAGNGKDSRQMQCSGPYKMRMRKANNELAPNT